MKQRYKHSDLLVSRGNLLHKIWYWLVLQRKAPEIMGSAQVYQVVPSLKRIIQKMNQLTKHKRIFFSRYRYLRCRCLDNSFIFHISYTIQPKPEHLSSTCNSRLIHLGRIPLSSLLTLWRSEKWGHLSYNFVNFLFNQHKSQWLARQPLIGIINYLYKYKWNLPSV